MSGQGVTSRCAGGPIARFAPFKGAECACNKSATSAFHASFLVSACFSRFRRFTLAAVGAALLAGCAAVGPDYRGPPDVAPLARQADSFVRARSAPSATAAPPPARWWDALQDPELSRLIDRALARSPTLEAARARILEARASLAQQRAGLYPAATASSAAVKGWVPRAGALGGLTGGGQQSAPVPGGDTPGAAAVPEPSDHTHLDYYTAGFDAVWEIDLFGGRRRGVEGARARAEAAAAQYEDAQVQLAAEVGQAYIGLRGAQQRLALARQDNHLEQRLLGLVQDRARLGTASDFDVQRVAVQVQQTAATAVPLAGQVEEAKDQLALLLAREPGALDQELALPDGAAPAVVPLPPAEVPVGDPAALLRRRPDIRAAERTLAASNAAIGQAVAQLFPSITLLGNIGFSSTSASDLFSRKNLAVLGAPLLRWNFLNFGGTRSQIRQARATRQEALARYDATVLAALQDAEGSLSRYGHQRDNVRQLALSGEAAARAQSLALLRYHGGTASLADALDAERQRLQTEEALAAAKAQLSIDYIALQKSLGLGWQPLSQAGLEEGDQNARPAQDDAAIAAAH